MDEDITFAHTYTLQRDADGVAYPMSLILVREDRTPSDHNSYETVMATLPCPTMWHYQQSNPKDPLLTITTAFGNIQMRKSTLVRLGELTKHLELQPQPENDE